MLNYCKGNDHPRSKLKEKEIYEIIFAYDKGRSTYRGLAKKYGVSPTAIGDILNNKTWRHLRTASKETL
jgi:Mor family transcriptional regulator